MEIKIFPKDSPEIKTLKLVMLEKNFSIALASKIAGVTEKTLYRWLNGKKFVFVNVVKVINRLKKARANF